ncbi:MAG: conjugal transfer protein TraF, partial [Nitrospiria bacterium]
CFKSIPLFIVLSLFTFSTVMAGEWQIIGPRALGMGGANVAVANDATASYWNPAAFGFFGKRPAGFTSPEAFDQLIQDIGKRDYSQRDWSIVLNAGGTTLIHGDLGEALNEITKFNFTTLTPPGGQISADKVSDFLQLLNALRSFDANKNRAVTILANGVLTTQIGHFGIGGYAILDVSAKGDLDLVNISPVSTGTTGVNVIDQFSDTTANNLNGGTPVPAGDHFFDAGTKNTLVTSIAALPGWSTVTATNYVQAVDFGLSQSTTPVPPDITTGIISAAELASNAQTGNSFADNQSSLLFKGIAVGEIPITYGVAVTEGLAIGGNIKYMKARVYNKSINVFDRTFTNALDLALDDYVDSVNYGIDIGILYRLGNNLRIGVVGRNLNSPDFDMKKVLPTDPDKFEETPQVRAGFAIRPVSFITLAADIDLTKNETTIGNNFKSQTVGGGVEIDLFRFLQLRAGAFKNFAEDDIGLVYTAGLGLNFWLLNFDIGAALSRERTRLEIFENDSQDDLYQLVGLSDDLPEDFRVEFALSMLF